ncbi:MAG: prepilin-type N-terminal cleavage/methylation domain-containing protein [Lentimonas sp.]|jgi:prepilin-type N-terminal cleavage/methylation domain-containing protein
MDLKKNGLARSAAGRGFTLIELLVVISIILIVSSVIFVGGNGGSGAKLSSAQRIASGVAQGARGQAILKGAPVRILIYTDSSTNNEDEKKLRYFGMVYGDLDAPLDAGGDPTKWIAATQGTMLPDGIYFNPELSASKWSAGSVPTMKLEYPRLNSVSEGAGDEYYYYGFNSNGTMDRGFNNAWMALQAGSLLPNGQSMEVDFSEPENEYLVAGLIFRRVGTTTLVSDPESIVP